MMNDNELKAVSEFYRRTHDLLQDGYRVMFAHVVDGLYLSKFVHRNGNRVMLTLSLQNGRLSQTKNGKMQFVTQVL